MAKKYNVFISFSNNDYIDNLNNVIPGNYVSLIMQALTNAGITFWIRPSGIYCGDSFEQTELKAIESSNIVIYVSSESSNKSHWTAHEIWVAEKKNKTIIPVRIDSSEYGKLSSILHDKKYIDFTSSPEKGCSELVHTVLSIIRRQECNITYETRPRIEIMFERDPYEMVKKIQYEESILAKRRQELIAKEDFLKREIETLQHEIGLCHHVIDNVLLNREHKKECLLSIINQLENESIGWQRWKSLKEEIQSILGLPTMCSMPPGELSMLSYLLNRKKIHNETKRLLSECVERIKLEKSPDEHRFNNLKEEVKLKNKHLEKIINLKDSLSQEIEEIKYLLCKEEKKLKYDVYSSVFTPAEVKRKSHMLVQIYLHLYEEIEKVKALAQESDNNAERRDYIPLQCKLKKGDKVDVQLNIYGETLLMSDKKSVVWQGSFTKCSFDYFVPNDIDVDELSCMALLTVNEIPVGEMRFITKIVETPRKLNPEIIAHKYNKVFISYAHKDESKVKSFHEGLKLAGIEHFFDRAYLQAGDVFPQVIQDYINSADLFVLFWSENASKSEYVDKERKQALERAFPQVKPQQEAKLSIYPMSIEPRAELPSDMRENYHFGEL